MVDGEETLEVKKDRPVVIEVLMDLLTVLEALKEYLRRMRSYQRAAAKLNS